MKFQFLNRVVRKRVFRPDQITYHEYLNTIPSGYSEIGVTAKDGAKLLGLSRPHNDAQYNILFLHGNGGNAITRAHHVAQLHSKKANIIVADYRGYGPNEGEPTEAGLLLDANAFLDFCALNSLPTIVLGHSLGAAISILLTAENQGRIDGLVTCAGVASVKLELPNFIIPFVSDYFDASSVASKIQIPWLLVHDIDDPIIGLDHARQLLASANKKPNRFVQFTYGVQHNVDQLTVSNFLDSIFP